MTASSKASRARKALLLAPIYLACALGAGLLWHRPVLLLTIYVLIGAVLLWLWHTKSDLLFFLAAFILGPAGELLAVRGGAWEYGGTEGLIPVWLPFAWGISFLFIKKTAEILTPDKEG